MSKLVLRVCLALFVLTAVEVAAAPGPVAAGSAANAERILLLLRPGAVPRGTLDLDLERLPGPPIDPALQRTLHALGVRRLERVVKGPLELPPVLPEMVPAGHPDPYDVERLYMLSLPAGTRLDEALDRLGALPSVLIAEPDAPVAAIRPLAQAGGISLRAQADALSLFPNDPVSNWGLGAVGAPTAWTFQTGRPSVRIAFLDTGGETVHPDLGGGIGSKLIAGHDFVHGDSDFHPDSGIRSPAHGMGVAGIAAALTHNSTAVAGLCGGDGIGQGCGVLMPKILGSRSILEWLGHSLAWLGNHHLSVDAIYWSLDRGADVLSNSWCSDRGTFTLPYTVHAAFRDAYARGALNVAAMGNSNGDCNQDSPGLEVPPASYNDVVTSVGAVDSAGNRVVTADWQSATGLHIDLAAPGLGVRTLTLGGGTAATQWFDGTSAATPFVSGAMGLVLSEIEERSLPLAHYDVPHLLRLTATDRGPVGHDVEYGAGILNVGKALEVLQPPYVIDSGTATPASGCHTLSGTQQWVFMHDFGLYIVKRCEVRKSVGFGRTYQSAPLVWGRPISTGGITPSNPNGQVTWTGVVPGTVTTSGATLRTYVYQRWTISGSYLGWYPRAPQNASFAWAAVGVPAKSTSPPPDPDPNPCDGFDYSQCQGLYDCQFQCVIGSSGSIGHECCACMCDGTSACPICLMPF